ncbi:TPA: lipopolysaccharide biosynthesis protein, partial [Streptococcus suis]
MIMEKQSRTRNSLINIITAVSGQGIGIIVSFVARIIFIRQLGEVYLGINSLYTNIVGLLSLAELGVGTAINYSLYKPLAENDIPAIKSLMALYRKVYTVIGFIILGIGIFLLPFLDMFMKATETSEIPHKHLIFFLF